METTLHEELVALRAALLRYLNGSQQQTGIMYFVVNEERDWYALVSVMGDILLETSEAAYERFGEVFELSLRYQDQRDTSFFAFKIGDVAKLDAESGLPRLDLLTQAKPV